MSEYKTINRTVDHADANIDAGLRAHMRQVYGLMATAMIVSGAVAYGVAHSPLLSIIHGNGILRMIAMFLPLVMVFGFGAAASRLSQAGATAFFYAFSAAMGLSMSYIFIRYTDSSIFTTFLTTAVAFGALSLYGYTTKRDISAWGRFLMMGVIGLIVASILNIFLGSGALQFAISSIGVLIFAGLTAYDTQNIKNQYLQARYASGMESHGKLAIFGALNLYLDFVNMFQFLLSFLGGRE